MLYSPFVLLNNYQYSSNHLASAWKKNLDGLTGLKSGSNGHRYDPTINKVYQDNKNRKRALIDSRNTTGGVSLSSKDYDVSPQNSINSILTKKRSLRDLNQNVTTHPLLQNNTYGGLTGNMDPHLPQMEIFNLDDLNVEENFFSLDCEELRLNDSYEPIYSRISDYHHIDSQKSSTQLLNQLNDLNIDYELESWPADNNDSIKEPLTMELPTGGNRSRISNPNFLKLFAIENNSIQNKNLPQISIDDQSLQNVTNIKSLNHLNFDPTIKLAIYTKKKIWIDLCNGIGRNDSYGDNCPWNLKFIPMDLNNIDYDNVDSNMEGACLKKQKSSLPSTGNNLTPWTITPSLMTEANEQSSTKYPSLLKPCGKLSRGQKHSDLQYVIKGWCDERFQ